MCSLFVVAAVLLELLLHTEMVAVDVGASPPFVHEFYSQYVCDKQIEL